MNTECSNCSLFHMGDFQNMLWVRKRVRWVLDEQFRHNRFYHSSASRTQFTSLDLCFHPVTEKLWRRKWLPTPVFLLRESCGQRSLVGCSPWGHTESDATEAILHACMGEGTGNPLQRILPGESQGRRSLVGCCLWGRTELDTTEVI